MIKPKPYDDLLSERMRENVREYEKLHFKDLYEKEFNKVADVKFPDRVKKPCSSARILDDDQLNTYEFYRLDHAGRNGSGDSPTGTPILEPHFSERKFHLSICGFQNLSA
jgi:hypothetical protein